MIYMGSDSDFDSHTSTTYYFGDIVKGEEYDNFSISYTSLYDDSCIKSWIEKQKINLQKSNTTD